MTEIRKNAARADAQTAVIEKRAAAPLSSVKLVGRWIEDDPRDDFAIALERDRHSKHRNAVQEVGRAIERIDDPAMGPVRALDLFALLAEEPIGRACLQEFVLDDLFGLPVGIGHEIARAFHGNLQVLHFPEITPSDFPALMAA